jgi:hypothetical protein
VSLPFDAGADKNAGVPPNLPVLPASWCAGHGLSEEEATR